MKRMIRVLLAAAVLVTSLTCSAFAATEDYTTDINGTVNYDTATGIYTATYTGDDLVATNQYVLLVATTDADGNRQITEEGIQYIDQTAVVDGSITFKFIPKNITDSEVLLGGEFTGGASPKVLGTIISQYTLGDVNNDKQVKIVDAQMALQLALGKTIEGANLKAADVDLNGSIKIVDAQRILKYALGDKNAFVVS